MNALAKRPPAPACAPLLPPRMAPTEEGEVQEAPVAPMPPPPAPRLGSMANAELDEWTDNVDEVSAQIKGIIDGTITDFDAFDKQMELKERVKRIRHEEACARRERFFLGGREGKGEGQRYKWWCRRCFVEYMIELPGNRCTRCQQDDKMIKQEDRRAELMDKLDDYKSGRAKHQWRKDTWIRWKKSQALLGRSRNINYKAWEYWEPDTDTEDEGDPIVPKDSPEFQAMEADIKQRHKKTAEKAFTAEKCRDRGNQCMKEGDFVGAIEHYDEGLEYKRDLKALWTNKALAELKVFRWHDAIASCNKVIEYSEIFEEGFKRSADLCFKAFTRRAMALRALHKWSEALEDLEDALKLYPKDKEARDLYEKTKAALEEAQAVYCTAQPDGDQAKAPTQPLVAKEPPASAGPVHIEIEETDDEEEEEEEEPEAPAATAGPASLAALNKKDFSTLLAKLKRDPAERVRFCARGSTSALPAKKKEDTRKVKLQVEEVEEPSQLDNALKDVERCCVLWKKGRGHVVPLRDDVKPTGDAALRNEKEEREADAFVQAVTPRVLGILHVLASGSDHHCALTAPAVRHVWPLLAQDSWRHSVLELIAEWSQRTISAKALAEFASRYPDPHMRLLLDAATLETKENILPPGFDAKAKQAASLVERGERSMDDALESVLEGLQAQSPAELAVSSLGNICLAGQANAAFRERISPLRDVIITGLSRQLKPANWRLCGRAAGALCNVVRLGPEFAQAMQEQALAPLIQALREECSEDTGPTAMLRQLQGKTPGGGGLPMQGSTARLLGALVNLLVVRPACAAQALELGALDLTVPLIDAEAAAKAQSPMSAASDEEGSPGVIAARAALLTSRLIGADPASLSRKLEADLLQRLDKIVRHPGCIAAVKKVCSDAHGEASAQQIVEQLELAARILTLVLTKTPGALDRLAGAAPRCEELPDDAEEIIALSGESVLFGPLVVQLIKIIEAAKPRDHVQQDEEGSTLSRLRGNLALFFAQICAAQASDDAPPPIRQLDLEPLVVALVPSLRMERGAVQNNIGVCVTRLAQNPRYRQKVRDLNGIESLHQIQLPKVEAQRAEAAKQHRIATSASAKQAEAKRRLQLKGLD
eukprot:CAMPEP_0195086172 /NCGR_PEP_ID=MMETSP0448-20130528/26371_1 /TAXON_ID=66468 /ORGANISM="Heterocapsa triquestra, Strain CCMP 448" /LENGTH=1109 /DNA_ID=CAMNT_0040119613 /DNA_START=1 /DNA_END=3330 /DNA_ORIENTATION=+